MRIRFSLFVVVLFVLAFSKAGFAQTQSSSAEEKAKLEERLVQLRAQQLKLERELKEAREEASKSDTPEMRKAREEAKKKEEREKKFEKNLTKAGVTGCRSEEELSAVKVGDRVTKGRSFYTYTLVRAYNPNPFPVNIEDEAGVAVYNLCAGGSVTLFRKIPASSSYNMQVRFRYSARATSAEIQGIAHSPEYYMSRYDSRNGIWSRGHDWTIDIRRVR